jgi:hypothetical protein
VSGAASEASCAVASESEPSLAERRLSSVLHVANQMRLPMALAELASLMPSGADWSVQQVSRWLGEHPTSARVVGELAVPPASDDQSLLAARLRRGDSLRDAAAAAVAGPLRSAAGLTRCMAVSGSAAYGFAEPGDDLDFFVIARRGATWLFLALSFLAARRRRSGSDDGGSPWCFNFVLDEDAAREQFSRPQGFQFAREALAVRVLSGEEYYRGLLADARWMERELPRLYGTRAGSPTSPRAAPVSLLARAANLALFPLLASYLHLTGLRRNHRLARTRPDRAYSTQTSLRQFALHSRRFDELHRLALASSVVPPATAPE